MSDEALGTLRSVVLSSDDVAATARFFSETLGAELKFVDGDRYAQLDAGGFGIAFAGGEERPAGGAAINVKVADVEAAVARAVEDGAEVVEPPTRGGHELRAALRAPGGPVFYVYSPL